ncbi:MAG: DNA mismatch repair protein MutS [Bacteroidota bacterium]|nr:DNA mismatch repair protein MutS [Bacteroidota bacterium]
MINGPLVEFQERINFFLIQGNQFVKIYNKLSIFRACFFISALVLLVYFANARNFDLVWAIILLFPIAFGFLVNYHNKVRYKRNHAFNLVAINEEEILKIQGNLKGFETGDRHQDGLHPYIKDLDIFGQNSVFQLLNRCNTIGGKALLAKWLKTPAPIEDVILRQDAVKELSPLLQWRQEFQARGRHFKDDKENIDSLLDWIDNNDLGLKIKWLKIALIILPIFALSTIMLWLFFDFHYIFPLAVIIINSIVLKSVFNIANDATEKTYKGNTALKSYGKLIEMIEETEFNSQRLQALKFHFHHQNFKASDEVKKLQTILDFLQVRGNVFYLIVNVVFILDVYWLLKGEIWKKKSGQFVKNWFAAIDEIEIINSMAGFRYANTNYSFPILAKENHQFISQNLGHPLIKSNIRVYNDFKMQGKGKIIIVTGSNMAGKSTFLRTVGVNVVLALMGAPVCASSLTLSFTHVFTSMRTEDNLEESVSSFYAELKRLKQLLTLLEQQGPVLFMLDEILKGTNSHDRHLGAIALIKQLNKLDASGFVSTHDIELGKIKDEIQEVENYSFNSEIIGDEIIFDYKVTPGICKNFNASKLMEKMGIKVNEQ